MPRPSATPGNTGVPSSRIGRTRHGLRSLPWAEHLDQPGFLGLPAMSVHLYLFALLEIPSVARGDHCIYSDAQMARRLNNVDVGGRGSEMVKLGRSRCRYGARRRDPASHAAAGTHFRPFAKWGCGRAVLPE
jgi:hypothetical protein